MLPAFSLLLLSYTALVRAQSNASPVDTGSYPRVSIIPVLLCGCALWLVYHAFIYPLYISPLRDLPEPSVSNNTFWRYTDS